MNGPRHRPGDAILSVLIKSPFLTVLPGALFLVLAAWARRRAPAIAGLLWLVYGAYEYGMKARVLCSGECNIRIDLLLLYPALIAVSVWALVDLLRSRLH